MDPLSDPTSAANLTVGPSLLELINITKAYGGVPALRGAKLRIDRPGTVQTLIGQNGCGKSSMLSILSGQLQPDSGEIRLGGQPVRFGSAADAVRAGIAMVAQETALAEELTVAENVLMGRMVRSVGGIDWSASRARARHILGRLGLDYDPRWIVSRLRPDQKQMVEIARAISLDTRILILDEPTSSLTEDEVRELFATIRELATHDVATLFVSHRLAEVFEISDQLTVMRDGRTVAAGPASNFTTQSLVDAMVGGVDLHGDPVTGHPAPRARSDRPLLEVRGLSSDGVVHGVDLQLHAGRVVGIAGLVGSGRSELLETIFGIRPLHEGSVLVDGEPLRRPSPRTCISVGIGYVPPDRKLQGLILPMSISNNLTMVATRTKNRLRPPGRKDERSLARRLAASVRMRAASMSLPVRALSGGNQQKVVFSKWMACGPRILLLDDPTRGVDVSAKADIHTQLRQAAADGLALVVTSSEIPELIDLCDEVLVMRRGAIIHGFDRAELSEAKIATVAAGGQL
jgi:ABC-type sugar transport system ATPase subunit